METVTIKGHIWFQTETGLRIGEGRAKLLEQIDLSGSIKEVGGKDGGRSILTQEGKKIVALFKKVDQCFKNFSEDESYRLSRGQE